MITLIHGKDNYRSHERLKEIIVRYQNEQRVLSARIIDAGGIDMSRIKEEFSRVSIFKGKQLIVFKGIFSSPLPKGETIGYLHTLKTSDTIIFFEEEAINKTDPLYLLIKKAGQVERFDPLNNLEIVTWARDRFKKSSVIISETALILLTHLVGNNLWRMANEVDKIANFKANGCVEDGDVKELVRDETGSVIFDTIDQIASRNAKTAYRLIHRHLDSGESPFYLLSMITFQFRNLLIIKSLIGEGRPYYSFNKLSGIHPFVIKKSSVLAQKFTIGELKKIYQKIFKVDFDIKRGRVEPITAIDLLIGDICLSRG
ncbi:MAG: DNA polymerase III subunit delta [bacterium]